MRHPTPRIRRSVVRAALVLAVVVPLACGDERDDGSIGAPATLDGRVFLSQSIEGRSLLPGTQIRLSFHDGDVGATAGCNSLSAPYAIVDGNLDVPLDSLTTTDIGCDPGRHAQDEWLADLLRGDPRLELDGDDLTIATATVTVRLVDRRVADPDRPLVGTRWRVDTVIQGDTASSVPDGAPTTLELDDDAITATSEGCTSVRVGLDTDGDGDELRFGDVTIDDIGCPSPWEATVELLRSGRARYTIVAGRLTLRAGDVGIAAVAD